MNPLLDFSGLPRFSDITPEHVLPAMEQLIAEARAAIAKVCLLYTSGVKRKLEIRTDWRLLDL